MNKFVKWMKVLYTEPKMFIMALNKYGVYNWMPDKMFLNFMFWLKFGKKINFRNPKTFNEKLQYLKVYNRNPKYCDYADKYLVREFIKQTIGEQHLIPLIAVYDSVDEIDWNMLPHKFVMKCTHASGRNVICSNKDDLNIEKTKKKLKKWISKNFYWHGREWVYRSIRPRIIVEQFLEVINGDLLDYKFFCFNGDPKCLFVASDRNTGEGLKVDFYDMKWNLMPFERHHKNSGKNLIKPKSFDKMIELSKKLSKGIPFVRVDFYEFEGNIYFGELTFFPGNGMLEFTPEYYDELLGTWIVLT
jgi:hypothetical protein